MAQLLALPGYMDIAVYNIVLYFSTEMWLHFRNVATNLIGHIGKVHNDVNGRVHIPWKYPVVPGVDFH